MGAMVPPSGQPEPMQPGEFTGASVPNLVTFKAQGIDPPTAVYIQRDDQLLVTNIGQGGGTLVITARLWLATEGRITTLQFSMNASGGAIQSKQFNLAEGYLLSLVVSNTGVIQPGDCYVVVFLNRGASTFPPPSPGGVLIASYLLGNSPACWPNGRETMCGDGPGFIRSLGPGNPAAGVDWSFTPGAQLFMQPLAVNATLTTSSTVANRQISLVIDDGTLIRFTSVANAAVPASTTATFSACSTNQTSVLITTTVFAVIPAGVRLFNLDRIRSVTTNLQAADQWSNIVIYANTWSTF